MNALLKSTNLNKSYRIDANNEQQVLFDVNVQVHRGEFISVMGPSGSGKSTLLYNLCGMDRRSSGSVQFKDHTLETLSEPQLARVRLDEMGFVFQQIHLLRNLSIMDNVLLPGYLSKRCPRRLIEERAEELLNRTGIASLADRSITQASGGQLQRVGICRALINEPDIIFGDEPTGALNSKASAEIMELLTEVNRTGTTILLVTHDVRVASRTHRVLLMKDGRLVNEKALGPVADGSEEVTEREAVLASWLQENEV
ncbi:MAG: ABC transporter ATP-binding protein [Candidatus Eisenbacteria sp.]|nr:ABC transporter ATP-binding protein [Candidatus Eisenbacteria bacterium]